MQHRQQVAGGQWRQRAVAGQERRMTVGMLPDRHFFEIVEAMGAGGE